MPKPKRANDTNLSAHWKVRIWMRGAGILHVLSKIEPRVSYVDGTILTVEIDYITDTEHGDTVGFIDWTEVGALTWRYAPLAEV
jgi:hypothetical protein